MSKISGATRLAIQTYERLARAERRVEELEAELRELIRLIPDEELGQYIRETDKIQKKQDARLEVYLRRMYKRAKVARNG